MSSSTLYAHDPRLLLSHLEPLLPASISVVGSILSNTPSSPSSSSDTHPFQALANFPDPSAPPDEWLIVVILPGRDGQIRLFHSLEAAPSPSAEALSRAQSTINTAVTEILADEPFRRLGAVHELWAAGLRSAIGAQQHPPCTTFLAPSREVRADGADLSGLVLDHGRPGDEVLIHEKNGYRALEWYAERLAHTSVLRPRGGGLPVAWVVTVRDGSTGALYTMPDYRRRGLAKAVIADRLRRCAELRIPSYCHVEDGNDVGAAMWTGLRWRPGHRVEWVYNDPGEKE